MGDVLAWLSPCDVPVSELQVVVHLMLTDTKCCQSLPRVKHGLLQAGTLDIELVGLGIDVTCAHNSMDRQDHQDTTERCGCAVR